ncbi:dethiobiotin synthase [Spongiibacter sp.]|uniref:dethiobiotin synthase n=1 Tax=Spongiibacter sp. TaxID=2024860 RepID=UPI003561C840
MSLRKRYFIAGTDTDAGKTLVACGLLVAAAERGLRTMALKPLAAGAERVDQQLRNGDALQLMAAMSESLSYEQVNPVVFAEPIAPHIAAERAGRRLTAGQLAGFCRGAMMRSSDLLLVEGAGGWRVPLNQRETLADLALALKLPVVLVVGMKLGCINHALLTVEAIRNDGLPLAGWVANHIDAGMACPEENLASLRSLIPAPCLGVVPPLGSQAVASDVSPYLDLSPLLAD